MTKIRPGPRCGIHTGFARPGGHGMFTRHVAATGLVLGVPVALIPRTSRSRILDRLRFSGRTCKEHPDINVNGSASWRRFSMSTK